MSIKDQLLTKINHHNAVVAIGGPRLLRGLPLAVALAEHGFPVLGIDVDARKVTDRQTTATPTCRNIPSERLAAIVAGGNPADDRSAPAGRHLPGDDRLRRPRNTATRRFIPRGRRRSTSPCDPGRALSVRRGRRSRRRDHIRPGMLVALESTTYPGTTEDLLLPMLMQARDHQPSGLDVEQLRGGYGLLPGFFA